MREVSDIIGDLVSQIDSTTWGEYDPDTTTTKICKTKWLRVGKNVVTDQPMGYTISQVTLDESAVGIPFDSEFNMEGLIYLPMPVYIHGTKLATNLEWTKKANNVLDKTPIIWLLETTRELIYGRGDSRERTMDLRMFFLDETNIKDFKTSDHRAQVVLPMQQLVLEFIETIGRNKNFAKVDQYEIITFSRFGVERDNGFFQNILDANLSGVELRLTLTKYKENCNC